MTLDLDAFSSLPPLLASGYCPLPPQYCFLRYSRFPPFLANHKSGTERGFMEEFQDRAALIEGRWKAENYSEQLFPEVAAQALAEADLPARVDPWEVIRWVHTGAAIPEHKDIE